MILCVGTTPTVQRTMVVERLLIDEVNRATSVHEHASGKSVNVARVLGVLGQEALAVGFAGGRRGHALLEDMSRAAIRHDFVYTQLQTRLCTTLIDQSIGAATELVEEAPAASPDEWKQLVARIQSRAATASAVVFSGTFAPGAPPDFCDRWIGRVPVVVVDARGEVMRRTLAARAGRVIAKLNRAELEQTLGERFDNDAQLCAAMRRAAPVDGWLIVTLGKEGALAWADDRLWRARSPKVRIVSAVGSGDAFAAGLVAAMTRGIQEALRLACACGTANALTPHSGEVHPEDLSRLLPEIEITPG